MVDEEEVVVDPESELGCFFSKECDGELEKCLANWAER